MRAALDSMEDPILHLAVHLTLVGVLREGEVAGLIPEDIDFDAANGMGTFTVNRSMQRVQKATPVRIFWLTLTPISSSLPAWSWAKSLKILSTPNQKPAPKLRLSRGTQRSPWPRFWSS